VDPGQHASAPGFRWILGHLPLLADEIGRPGSIPGSCQPLDTQQYGEQCPDRNHADPLGPEVSNAHPSSAALVRSYFCLSHHHGLLGRHRRENGRLSRSRGHHSDKGRPGYHYCPAGHHGRLNQRRSADPGRPRSYTRLRQFGCRRCARRAAPEFHLPHWPSLCPRRLRLNSIPPRLPVRRNSHPRSGPPHISARDAGVI